jgi:integrase
MAPKSAKGYRAIALSDLMAKALAAHLAAFSTGQDGLVFHADGRPIDRKMPSAAMPAATKMAGLAGVAWHALRHHHASVLLSAGVSPALVAERLGHDLRTLLRTYRHVIRSDEERVQAIVGDALGGSAADRLRTDAVAGSAAGRRMSRSRHLSAAPSSALHDFGFE